MSCSLACEDCHETPLVSISIADAAGSRDSGCDWDRFGGTACPSCARTYSLPRIAACEMRRADQDATRPDWVSGRWRSVRTQVDERLPLGHLLWNPPRSLNTEDLFKLIQERNREIAQLEESRKYYQHQIEQYRETLWRPWIHIHETREEILDLPPEIVPQLPESPADQPLVSAPANPPPQPRTNPPKVKLKVRDGWQPIDRPLPADFDKRDVDAKKDG